MKKGFVLAAIVALTVLALAAQGRATIVNPVSFWIYDQPGLTGDGKTTFQVTNLDWLTGASVLQYSVDDSSAWNTTGASPISIDGAEHKLTFRLLLGGTEGPITTTSANLNFLAPDGIYFNSAYMLWSTAAGAPQDLTFVVAANKDKLSPSAVPLPPAVTLFVPGLLGLIGLRRRIHKD
jgi:hypothetical protein